MKIITTRTQPGGDQFADRLRMLGHDALAVPVLCAQALDFDLPDLNAVKGLVITSGHALDCCGIIPSDMPVYTVGSATAIRATQAGWTRVIEGPGDALSLSKELPDTGKLLHLCAADVAVKFEAENVVRLPVYETVPDDAYKAVFGTLQEGIIMVHSARAAAILRTYVQGYADRMQEGSIIFLCLSLPVVESLTGTSHLSKGVYVADTPTEDALIAALKRL